MDKYNISINEVHKLLKEGLLLLDKYAKEYGVRYYLHAGTVLGAVRHQDFIPWDDDADIIVPVVYYADFINTLKKNDLGKFEVIYRDKRTTRMQAKLVLKGQDEDLLCIDIFPLIGTSSDVKKQVKQCKYYTRIRSMYFWRNANWRISKNVLKKMCKLVIRFILHAFPDKWFYKRFDKIMYQFDFNQASYVTNPCGKYKLKNVIPKNWYGDSAKGKIGDALFPIPSNTTDYLHHYYKDYEQLPPEEYRSLSVSRERLFIGTQEEYDKCIHH